MAASMTSAAVRFWAALVAVTAASVGALLFLPASALADAPGARSYALTPLEQERIATPEQGLSDARQQVVGYLRHTKEGWKLDVLPGAVRRNGPLPVLTSTVDAAPENASSHSVYPYAPLLRIDF
ncbi:hypothetical protein [Hyalangium minutum]|uniref:Uncharacterized protein n=1 Tax=Hyalangium minutum TaxID=394096 RepID=A0A085WEL0_9BACT|nr:hypothetical protein [Hyalangium minutum]KFE66123.1 hypothetical protein DB31_1188 [Hyalangium minutum]